MVADNPDRIEVLPVLPSLDIGETLSFYRGRLGFEMIVYQDKDYLILRRDEMELHFWLTDDRSLCERTSVYLRGGGIAGLHAEYKARGVETLSDMMVRPWNMEEFYIHDPAGNLLRFGRIPRPV
ncbi:bleomycin resistance protein [Rhizobium metallidurans]|uniref:Catechol 2,3-dioxygenase-like lactoylglutathione lyase family enzyme n=1 Tax=Rhizobium metallidurans TaxID=1265931 RepID=A0A7W6CWE6_9HYPH|nr:VOC family protein [Rhizobium metallidurans]MBB3964925.1 catechol 2,3-dioxygenase-like lactoylglutathione lyase family enzyme [Rhizobium metallidurans]